MFDSVCQREVKGEPLKILKDDPPPEGQRPPKLPFIKAIEGSVKPVPLFRSVQ